MTKNKKRPNRDFSHIETDKLRATFIENPELQKDGFTPDGLVINVGRYLNLDDPILKDCEIVLHGFVPVLDHAKDEVLYIKVKPEGKTIIYHLTSHPDSLKALHEISLDAKRKGFAMVDSKVHIQQAAEMLKKRRTGTLETRPGRHPGMNYLD